MTYRSRSRFFDCNLLNLEPQNNGPNETESQSGTSVHDIVGSHVLQVNSLFVQE